MKFRKRYLLLLFPFVLAGIFRLSFFEMRDSDEKIREMLDSLGVQDVTFHDYDFEGRNMHYVHVGQEGKPLIVLIHGTPGSCSMYSEYLGDTSLQKHAQMVAVDRAGLGFSGYGEAEVSLKKQAAAIQPIFDKHQTNGIFLLGHSYGGPVVSRLAMDYPKQINGMTIVAGSIAPELEPREWWRGPVDFPLIRWILPPSLKVSNQEIMYLYDELNEMMPLWDHIECPTVVFQGTQDNLVAPGNADFAEKMIPSPTEIIYIEEGDHFILWSEMDQIVQKMIDLMLIPKDTLSTISTLNENA